MDPVNIKNKNTPAKAGVFFPSFAAIRFERALHYLEISSDGKIAASNDDSRDREAGLNGLDPARKEVR